MKRVPENENLILSNKHGGLVIARRFLLKKPYSLLREIIFKKKRDETTSTRSSSDPLGRAAPILNSRRYFIMRWGNCASLLVMSSDYEFIA